LDDDSAWGQPRCQFLGCSVRVLVGGGVQPRSL